MIKEIINGDCMDCMAGYADNKFDLAIVDPPYGIGISKKKTIGTGKNQTVITKYKKKNWDNKIPDKEYFNELNRVSKNQIIFGGNYFVEHIGNSRCWIFWDKKQPDGNDFSAGEFIYTSFDQIARKICMSVEKNCISNNAELAKLYAKIHPTQKPIKLYKWLLEHYANRGDKIIDTHLGSGSSAIAAHYYDCEFTGIELDRDYYNDSLKRIKNKTSQIELNYEN